MRSIQIALALMLSLWIPCKAMHRPFGTIEDEMHDFFRGNYEWSCTMRAPVPEYCGKGEPICRQAIEDHIWDVNAPHMYAFRLSTCQPLAIVQDEIESALSALATEPRRLLFKLAHIVPPIMHLLKHVDETALHNALTSIKYTDTCTPSLYMSVLEGAKIRDREVLYTETPDIPIECMENLREPAEMLIQAYSNLNLRDKLNIDVRLPELKKMLNHFVYIYWKLKWHMAGGLGWQCFKDLVWKILDAVDMSYISGPEWDGDNYNIPGQDPKTDKPFSEELPHDGTGLKGYDPYDIFAGCHSIFKHHKTKDVVGWD